jgi:hypothetical protein
VRYLDFLGRVHEVLEPPTYLEIGIRHGDSLALARSAGVGIDPAYRLRTELPRSTALFRETSDEYFDRAEPLAPLGGRPVGMGFIDGMHLVEYALRDFVNVERSSHWAGAVVFDDIYPRDAQMAARRRKTRLWTGDVYKMVGILARYRPDLICLRVDTRPTGLLLVLGLDPASTLLLDRYDQIVLDTVVPDPQPIPADILDRRGAIAPEAVLSASFWSALRDARERGLSRRRGLRELRRRVRAELGVDAGRRLGPLVLRPRSRRTSREPAG